MLHRNQNHGVLLSLGVWPKTGLVRPAGLRCGPARHTPYYVTATSHATLKRCPLPAYVVTWSWHRRIALLWVPSPAVLSQFQRHRQLLSICFGDW